MLSRIPQHTHLLLKGAAHLFAVSILVLALRGSFLQHDSIKQVRNDAFGYVLLAYNLSRLNTFTSGCESYQDDCSKEEFYPTNYREPAFPAILAGASLLHPQIRTLSRSQYMPVIWDLNPEVHRMFRTVQWIMLWLSAAMAMVLVMVLTGSWIASYSVFYLVGTSPTLAANVPKLLSEHTAAMFLTATALFTALALTRNRVGYFGGAGVFLALLTLTKAQFLYTLPAYFAGLIFSSWCYRTDTRQTVSRFVYVLLPYALIVGAWCCRNYVHMGTFALAGRGGAHLHLRLAYNEMTFDEWKASFLIWNPDRGAKEALRSSFPPDIGSRFDDGSSTGFRKIGKSRASGTDGALKERALDRIFSNPLKHLAISVSMAYRSMFVERERQLFGLKIPWGMGSLALYLAAAVMIAVDAFGRRGVLAPIMFLLVGNLVFFGLFSNAIPRYSEPFLPILYCSVGVVITRISGTVWNLAGAIKVKILELQGKRVISAPLS